MSAALSPARGDAVHSVAPVRASRQKSWPFLRWENPNNRSPTITGEFIYIDASLVCQTVLPSRTANTPLSSPGEVAVPNVGAVSAWFFEASFRHRSFPVSASQDERMPLMPNV